MAGLVDNRASLRNAIAEECNREVGADIYQKRLGAVLAIDPVTKVGTRAIEYSFNQATLEAWLREQPFYAEWALTDQGRRRLDPDYLSDLAEEVPAVKPIKHARDTLAQLKDDKLRHQERDGYIKAGSICLYAVTGRNQPKVSEGFLFNAPPWFRSVIRPQPGMALIQLDWSKQEPAIGVVLSGDTQLRAAYESADLYLSLAQMAGAVAADADPNDPEVQLQRQVYKAASLGLSYGMGAKTLARRFYLDLNRIRPGSVSRREALNLARRIIRWHRREFAKYWHFLHTSAEDARHRGWTTSDDGWLYFADAKTPITRLINFPMQATGGVLLREAMKAMAFTTEIDVVASLHDALYVQCRMEDLEETVAITRAAMTQAVQKVLGDAIEIKIGIHTYTHDKPYRDARGAKMLTVVERLVAQNRAQPRPLVEDVAPRSRRAA